MSNRVIQAMYNDDDILMDAVKEVRAANHHIAEVYTPFPVHGLDKAMGLKGTRIAITAFLYGCVGFSFSQTKNDTEKSISELSELVISAKLPTDYSKLANQVFAISAKQIDFQNFQSAWNSPRKQLARCPKAQGLQTYFSQVQRNPDG